MEWLKVGVAFDKFLFSIAYSFLGCIVLHRLYVSVAREGRAIADEINVLGVKFSNGLPEECLTFYLTLI